MLKGEDGHGEDLLSANVAGGSIGLRHIDFGGESSFGIG
jgi:hypothetical protein